MSTPKTLLPLRIPELGPSFGKLVTGTGRDPGGLDLSAVRNQLVSKLFDHAGEARRLAANDERAPAIAALARANWLAAWEEAVAAVADMVWAQGNARLVTEADSVTMPPKLRERLSPGTGERRALISRLGSAGAGMVRALDDLERYGAAALDATSLERPHMDGWLNTLRMAARRLEDSWILLEGGVEGELRRFDAVIERVARWRKPWWPVLLTGAVALSLAVWLGLVLGGYLPPGFLAPLVNALPE